MPRSVSETPKVKIIEIYGKIMTDYFSQLCESEIIKELNYPHDSICSGINVIHRVFEIVLIKTKNLKKTYHYSQKAYYYYLEYIDQIYRANLSQNLNNVDIVLFVYKKTIYDIYDGDEDDESSQTLSNIMTLNNDVIQFDEQEWREILLKIMKLINLLFHWSNTRINFHERCILLNKYLLRFIYNIDKTNSLLQILEIVQEKTDMSFVVYDNLLSELLKKIESVNSKNDTFSNDSALLKFYIEESTFQEKFETGNMKDFVKWLYL
uniref:Uncharacterized protein n=1 Tax=viral metagenome TaxID=1070528 RepID=A0A6C0JEL0_9ZZZZ